MISRVIVGIVLFVVVLLAAPSILVSGQQQQASSSDWLGPNGPYNLNWNYNPQNAINSGNVGNLQVQWIFPIPGAPAPYTFSEGVIITPIVVAGIAYFITNYHALYALDTTDGHVVWTKSLPIQAFQGAPVPGGHYHAIWYTDHVRGKPLVWIATNNYTIFAFNALNGDSELTFNVFNESQSQIPGNFGTYAALGGDSGAPGDFNINIDQARGILVAGTEGSEDNSSPRGFFAGFDITSTPPKWLWTTFMIPPQDGSDPNWSRNSVNSMQNAYIFNGTSAIDLKALSPNQVNSIFHMDWGSFGFNGTHSFAGADGGWGGAWALDESRGVAYVGTAEPAPDFNASTRPGPNLWSDSVLAINTTNGEFIWGFQTTTHDLYDYDCSWSVILANATINGAQTETVFKGCKNGYVYALDAITGKLLWYYDSPSIKYTKYTFFLDPRNATAMSLPWPTYPNGPSNVTYDSGAGTGNIESDPAYDPSTNMLFVATYNQPFHVTIAPVSGPNGGYGNSRIGLVNGFAGGIPAGPANTTITAIDVNTGQPKWTFFIDNVPYRGGVVVSGGVVYTTSVDGIIRMINESNGILISKKVIGGPIIIEPAIAKDPGGNVKVIFPLSASLAFPTGYGQTIPGAIVALGLSAGQTTTTTTSASTSQSASSTQTVTVTQSATGIDPSTFYATVAVAVIALIAAGVLAVTRRRPRV